MLPRVKRLVKKYVIPKGRGRKKKEDKDEDFGQLIGFLVKISNRPEYKGKLIVREILELKDAQPTVKKLRQLGHTRIARYLREHPEFGGFVKKTGPNGKKGKKT